MSDETDTDLNVIRFIVCQSEGGPFDDESFLAGCYFEEWERRLQMGEPDIASGAVPTGLVPQLDLLAMHWGYQLEVDEDDEGWTFVMFTRVWDEDTIPTEEESPE